MVTDSTSSLPPGVGDDLLVVPLHVVLGERTGVEGRDVQAHEVAEALRGRLAVSTSRPSPGEFAAVYRSAPTRCLVSVHLSAALSGTLDAARLAASEVAADGIEVHVVDSGTIAMGLGFAALAAADAARQGAGAQDVAELARDAAARASVLFSLDSLEHLRRGGRIGPAATLLGTALQVKPILHVTGGRIQALDKVRTSTKALARLEQRALERAGTAPVDLAVHHLDAPERAEQLADRLRGQVPGLRRLYLSQVGASVGPHVGPGVLGVVVAPV